MKTVYILYGGDRYEFGQVLGVYEDLSLAVLAGEEKARSQGDDTYDFEVQLWSKSEGHDAYAYSGTPEWQSFWDKRVNKD